MSKRTVAPDQCEPRSAQAGLGNGRFDTPTIDEHPIYRKLSRMLPHEDEFRHNTRKVSDAERFRALALQTEGRVDWYLGKGKPSPADDLP